MLVMRRERNRKLWVTVVYFLNGVRRRRKEIVKEEDWHREKEKWGKEDWNWSTRILVRDNKSDFVKSSDSIV